MSTDLAALWRDLSEDAVALGDIRVGESPAEVEAGIVLVGLDTKGQRHLLVPLPDGVQVTEDRASRGVQLLGRNLIDGAATRSYMDVVCRAPHLSELFSVLAQEMLDSIRECPDEPVKICRSILHRWRELLERERSSLLSTEQLAGLFGELVFLSRIIELDGDQRLDCWTGPSGARHDFSRGGNALEVKATLLGERLRIEVHGLGQLDVPEDGSLHLAVLRLELSQSNGVSLPDILDTIRDRGVDMLALASLLRDAGYELEDGDAYSELRFRIREERVYPVDSHFPRIVPSKFVAGDTDTGILAVRYQLELTRDPVRPLDEEGVAAVLRSIATASK